MKDDKLEEKEVKEEPKEEVKEIKDLTTNELEEAIDLESKESVKEEVKEEIKEEVKEEVKELEEGQPLKEEQTEIPEKYRDKKIDDIIQMHQEAEKLMHGKAQEASRYRKMLEDKYAFDGEGNIVGTKEPQPQTQQGEDIWLQLEESTGLPRKNLQSLMQLFDVGMKQQLKVYEDKLKPLQESQAKSKYDQIKKSLKPTLPHLETYEKEMDEFVKERKIPTDSLITEEAVKTIYHTVLGRHFDEKREKKKAESATLKKVSEKEKTEAQLEQSTKTVTEEGKDINTMSLDALEKNLPKQEIKE